MAAFDEVRYEVRDRVATVTLHRPEKLNAWTLRMQQELRRAIEQARDDADVRVIVVTGAGRGFCAGADVTRFGPVLAGTAQESDVGPIARDPRPEAVFDQPLSYPLGVSKPIIAAINGIAVGIGLCFTLYCDVRFMSATAKLAAAFPRLGLVAEYGSAWLLPRLVGTMNAFDILASGRPIDAHEAERMGLVRVLAAESFGEQVHAYAAELAKSCSPRSLAVIKRQIVNGLFGHLSEACVEADREMLASFGAPDLREGIAAFFEKRAPQFRR